MRARMPDKLRQCAVVCRGARTWGVAVKTIDEMLSLRLLTPDQHSEIGAWIAQGRTPEAILQMPPSLWRTLELASVLMDFDRALLQPPSLDEGS